MSQLRPQAIELQSAVPGAGADRAPMITVSVLLNRKPSAESMIAAVAW